MPLPTAAQAWHDIVLQTGDIARLGCCSFPWHRMRRRPWAEETVDIDGGPGGNLVFDAHKVRRWLVSSSDVEAQESEAVPALQVLTSNGELELATWPAHFTVPLGLRPDRA